MKKKDDSPANPALPVSERLPNGALILRLLAAVDCVVEAGKALASGFPPGHERALEPIRWAHSTLGELVKDLTPKPAAAKATRGQMRRRRPATRGKTPAPRAPA